MYFFCREKKPITTTNPRIFPNLEKSVTNPEIPHCQRNMQSDSSSSSTSAPRETENLSVNEKDDEVCLNKSLGKRDLFKSGRNGYLPKLSYRDQISFCDMDDVMCPPTSMPFMAKSINPLENTKHGLRLERQLAHARRIHNLKGISTAQPPRTHSNNLKIPLIVDLVKLMVKRKFIEVKQKHKNQSYFEDYQANSTDSLRLFLQNFPNSFHRSIDEEVDTSSIYRQFMESIYANIMNEKEFLSKTYCMANENGFVGDTLKQIISKSMSEKLKFKESSSDENSIPSSPDIQNLSVKRSGGNDFSFNYSKEFQYLDGCSPPKREKRDSIRTKESSKQELDDNQLPVKKTRPKRGQYRKYNSQLLMDAVKAVQRGEMSVHRAGSYYGVPHSTLEYKVKERHLLRQKKSRDIQLQSVVSSDVNVPNGLSKINSNPKKNIRLQSSTPVSTMSTASSSSECVILKSPSTTSEETKSPPLPVSSGATGSKSPMSSALVSQHKKASNTTWFPSYIGPNDFDNPLKPNLSLNNSASELLRKLQHKVQTRESSFSGNAPFEFLQDNDTGIDFNQSRASLPVFPERRSLYNQSI